MDKQVTFDRKTRDWTATLNGQYVGSFSSPMAAHEALDKMVVAYEERH
jgi:hypothetical protein